MIENYFRPNTLEEAVRLLKRDETSTYPLGGGNVLSHFDTGKISVVDLQLLKLDRIQVIDKEIQIGANVTLQDLIENVDVPKGIKDSALREASINIRQTATVAGTLVSSRGRSPLAAAMLVAGAQIIMEPETERVDIDQWFAKLESGKPPRLVLRINIPVNTKVLYMDISKTPSDYPFAFSAIGIPGVQNENWAICIGREREMFFVKKINELQEKTVLENAYRHFNRDINNLQYNKKVIEVLFHRLTAEANIG